jgi:hypothetical protein
MKKINKSFLITLFFAIILPFSVFGTRINEIMYNPAGDDNNREYIELYSEGMLNLSGYIISDGDSNDTLKQIKTSNSKYSLIVEDDYNFSDLNQTNVAVYFIGASIGNGLSEEDIITIYDKNKQIIDSVAINKSLGNGNNKSMSFYNNVWIELDPTPGYENRKIEIIINTTLNNQSNQSSINTTIQNNTQITNNQTIINQTESNTTQNIIINATNTNQTSVNVTEPIANQSMTNQTAINQTSINQSVSNNTIINNTTNNTNSNTTSVNNITQVINLTDNTCDISIHISTDKEAYENHEKISFYNKLNYDKISYVLEYWAENSEGKIIKNKVQTTNQNKKSYTPIKRINGEIIIKATIRSLSCKDINLTNNQFNKTVIIGEDPNKKEEERTNEENIENVTKEKESKTMTKLNYELIALPKKVKANEPFEIEVKIQNNNQENSFELSSYVYKGSKCYSSGREENKITISLGKGEIKTVKLENLVVEEINGTYNLKVKIRKNNQKTFKELKEQIEVENEHNSEKIEDDGEETIQKKQSEDLLSSKKNINSDSPLEKISADINKDEEATTKKVLYQSSSEKLKKNINYLILFLSATVALVTVWKYERKGNKRKD